MKKPIAYEAYEELADAFADKIATKPHNAFYDRPATLSLLPDVRGKRVLDAGCGPGAYLQILADMGARVTGIDNSEKMLSHAARRVGDRALLKRQNMDEPLDLADQEFDVVISALAVTYIEDLNALFKEFHRILKAGGCFIFSTEHPFFTYKYHQMSNYFDTQLVDCIWHGFDKPVRMVSHHHSLSTLTNALLESGFCIEKILEPKPVDEFEWYDQEGFRKLNDFPIFIHMKGRKR